MINYKKLVQYDINGPDSLSIPGTNQIGDFLISADCLPDKTGNHRGCMKAARWLIDDLCITKDYFPERNIVIDASGHSLGGGIALCFSWILENEHGRGIEISTIGSLRTIGRSNGLKGVRGRIYGNDPIPALFWPFYWYGEEPVLEGPKRKWWKIPFCWKDHVRY